MKIVGSAVFKINSGHPGKKLILPGGSRVIRGIPLDPRRKILSDRPGCYGGDREKGVEPLSSGNTLLKMGFMLGASFETNLHTFWLKSLVPVPR